ncbi:hypothetical protein EON65_27675 [archaeon]|nr:MAG: hypothetical protein EON65_27675 [archaeon]
MIARFSSEELAGKLLPKPVELQSLTEDYCHSQSFVSLNNNLPRDSTMKDIDADEEMLIMRKIAQNAMDSLCSLIELTRRHFPLCWIHTLRTLQCLLMVCTLLDLSLIYTC